MSKEKPWAKYVLPEVIDPPRICTTVQVPNDIQHIGAFLGAIRGLASAYNWADDTAHTAKDVALVWRDVFDNIVMGNCSEIFGDDVQFRQDGCKLQISVDCVNWQTIFDASLCIVRGASQQGTAGELEPGACYETDVTLSGNGQWISPVPVKDGYTVTISLADGGWAPGDGTWACPSGQVYTLGFCGLPNAAAGGGAPLPAAPLGRLVAVANAIGYDAYNQSFVIGGTAALVDLILQMNDSDISNNAGSVSFHVSICATAEIPWDHTYDFTVSDQGWAAFIAGGVPLATYSAGNGWRSILTVGNTQQIQINKILAASAHFTQVIFEYSDISTGIIDTYSLNFTAGPYTGPSGSHQNIDTGTIAIDASTLRTMLNNNSNTDTITLHSLRFIGTGPEPTW
jgi:hypothetical protein